MGLCFVRLELMTVCDDFFSDDFFKDKLCLCEKCRKKRDEEVEFANMRIDLKRQRRPAIDPLTAFDIITNDPSLTKQRKKILLKQFFP